jgi:hypothetical protein
MYIYAIVMFVVENPDIYQTNYILRGIKGKGKVLPRTGHEGPEGE